MKKTTEAEIRCVLEYAIREQDPDAARTAIIVGFADGIELHKMTDLHFPAMLLLAAPKKEKRGRPKSPDSEDYTWYLNMACKIRADIDGESYSKTWAAYCDHRTRPKAVDYELWRCAGILEMLTRRDWKSPQLAIEVFELTPEILETYKSVNK